MDNTTIIETFSVAIKTITMGRPTLWQVFRQTVGRAFRETGQALDRVGIKVNAVATTRKTIGDDPVIYQDFLSRHRQFMPLLRRGRPVISDDVAFIAPCATLIGSVYVGPNSSIFYKSILRADNCDNAEAFKVDSSNRPLSIQTGDDVAAIADSWELDPERLEKHKRTTGAGVGGGIFIGENTNIQDGCIIDSAKGHTRIGNGVTVGHLASIHSATIEDHCLIGMGSLIGENVLIKEESFIAAGAKLSPGTVVESGELWVGQPARKLRDLSPEERQRLHYQANEVRSFTARAKIRFRDVQSNREFQTFYMYPSFFFYGLPIDQLCVHHFKLAVCRRCIWPEGCHVAWWKSSRFIVAAFVASGWW